MSVFNDRFMFREFANDMLSICLKYSDCVECPCEDICKSMGYPMIKLLDLKQNGEG